MNKSGSCPFPTPTHTLTERKEKKNPDQSFLPLLIIDFSYLTVTQREF